MHQGLINVTHSIAMCDVLLAFSEVALENSYTEPVIVNEPSILVKEGRHPLQEMLVSPFTPNDVAVS